MDWWNQAIFDTCSVITLDKVRQISPQIGKYFPKTIQVIAATFSNDQLHKETAERMRNFVSLLETPANKDLSQIYKKFILSNSLSEVDKLVFATAVHNKVAVVTADRQLGRAILARVLKVNDMAGILRELVMDKRLAQSSCEKLLVELANRRDLILGTTTPSWNDLRKHKFPNR